MACSVDHSKVTGLKFCIECGVAITSTVRTCVDGHELVRENKFCEICGQGESSSTNSSPLIQPPRVSQPTTPFNFSTAEATEFPPYQPSAPSKKNSVIIISSVVAGLAVLLGVVINSNRVTYTDVTLSMSIYDQNCYNLSWGYYDIPNAEVILYVDGASTAYASYPRYGDDNGISCVFETTFYDVPMNGEYYDVEMASGRRGRISNSQEDLMSNDWAFELSLGL